MVGIDVDAGEAKKAREATKSTKCSGADECSECPRNGLQSDRFRTIKYERNVGEQDG